MTHLEGGLDELQEQVEAAVGKPTAEAVDQPPDTEVWTFPFTYTDTRGSAWSGTFTNEILDLERQGYVAILRSRLQGGQPYDSIDPSVADLNLMVAWMSYSLRKEGRPEWAKNLLKLRDPDIIGALYAKVRAHEDRWFRRAADQGASKSSD
jgi:hypothetical protein